MHADAKRRRGDSAGPSGRGSSPLFVTVESDGSDSWRLDPIIRMLQEGAVGPCAPVACRTSWPRRFGCHNKEEGHAVRSLFAT